MNFVWWQLVIACVCSYFFGNISVARFVAKSKNADVTKLGSGNPGTTNILRNFGFKLGLLNLVLDMAKGAIPALAGYLLFGHNVVALYLCGLCTIVGHIYPVVFKFKGGKGMATMMGVFMVANPIATLIVLFVALICWLLFEYGAVATFLCETIMVVVEGVKAKELVEPQNKIVCLILYTIFLITWFAHRANIERLLCGKENKASLIKKTKKELNKKNNKV